MLHLVFPSSSAFERPEIIIESSAALLKDLTALFLQSISYLMIRSTLGRHGAVLLCFLSSIIDSSVTALFLLDTKQFAPRWKGTVRCCSVSSAAVAFEWRRIGFGGAARFYVFCFPRARLA